MQATIKFEGFKSKKIKVLSQKKIANPIAKELERWSVPSRFEIDAYLTALYSHFRYGALAGGLPDDEADEAVHTFVLSMLNESPRTGIVRYTLYDPERYPGVSYHAWLFNQLKFTCKHHRSQKKKEEEKLLYVESFAQDSGNVEDIYSRSAEVRGKSETPQSILEYRDILRYVKNFSEEYSKAELCFEKYAYDLLNSKLLGETSLSFAGRVGISSPGCIRWSLKLKKLISAYFKGKPARSWRYVHSM